MTEVAASEPNDARDPDEDLVGSADDRERQLSGLLATTDVSSEWLLRQLRSALVAWAADQTTLEIEEEARVDY